MPVRHTEFQHVARIDAQGWRNPCDEGDNRRFLVGDSFVFGIGVVGDETLQCELSQRGIDVYAAGVPGAGATQYLAIIGHNGARLTATNHLASSAELILSIFAGNDFESMLDFRHDKQQAEEPGAMKKLATWINALVVRDSFLRHSYAVQLAKLALEPVIKRLLNRTPKEVVQLGTGSTLYKSGTDQPAFVLRLDVFFGALEEEADAAGLGPITLLLIPDVNEISESRREFLLAVQGISPNFADPEFKRAVLLEAAGRHGFGVIDGYDCLTDGDLYYRYDNHLRPPGVEQLAVCIAAHYAERSALKNGDRPD